MTARLTVVAVVLALATLVLGYLITHRPPASIDLAAVALRGQATSAALFFTSLGRWWMLLPIAVIAFGVAMSLRANLVPLVIVLGTQAASQAATALVKSGFHRVRPGGFIGDPESDLSFPSGHSVTALVFFAGLAILAWHSPLPRPVAVAAVVVLGICVVGIPWSRLALGAHYATDVIGGLLFGGAWLCAAIALMMRFATTATR